MSKQEHTQTPSNNKHALDNFSGADEFNTSRADQSDRSILLVAKGGSIVFSGTVFAFVIRFVIGISLTRLLGSENYGLYNIAITFGSIGAGLAVLGLDYALVRFVSLFASRDDTAGLWGTLQIGLGLPIIASLLFGIGLFAMATPIAEYIIHDLRLVSLLRIASITVPLLTLTIILAAATRGFNKMQYEMFAIQMAQPLLRLILIGLMALVGLTVTTTLVIYILGLVVAIALLVYYLNRLFPLIRSVNSARRDTKGVLIYSLPAYFSKLIEDFGGNLQTILLGSLNTLASAGIFAATSQISKVSNMFNISLGRASNPIIAALHDKGELVDMNRFYQTTAKWMFTVNLLFFIVIITFPSEILNIFGRDFVEGATALVILTVSNLAVSAIGVAGGVLNMTGKTSLKLMNSVVYSVLSIVLNLLLIPQWGVVGAATAALISSLAVSLLQVIEVFRLFHILPLNITFVKPIVAGLLAYSVGLFIHQSFQTEGNLVMIAINALVIFFVYVGVVFALGLSNEDRVVIEGFRNRLFGMFSKSRSNK